MDTVLQLRKEEAKATCPTKDTKRKTDETIYSTTNIYE